MNLSKLIMLGILLISLHQVTWATESAKDPNCPERLEANSAWVTARQHEVPQLMSRFNNLTRQTAPGEAATSTVIYGEDTDVAIRIMGAREKARIHSSVFADGTESVVKHSRRALAIKIKSESAFAGLIHLLTDHAQQTLVDYMKKVGVARVTAILQTPAGNGRINIDVYEPINGNFRLIVGEQERNGFARRPNYLREYLIRHGENLDEPHLVTFNQNVRRIEFVNNKFAVNLGELDLARYGTDSQLAIEVLHFLGLRFDPFREDSEFFVQKDALDGSPWPAERTRVGRKLASALQILTRERFTYVDENARVPSRLHLSSGWMTNHQYHLTWEAAGFNGYNLIKHYGRIDGMKVSTAAAMAIHKIEKLGFHWNEFAKKYVR